MRPTGPAKAPSGRANLGIGGWSRSRYNANKEGWP
jgi:hypothetical protein